MKMFYYIDNNGTQQGPFTAEELKDKGLNRKTKIWYEGISNWVEASKVDELNFLLPPKPNETESYETKPDSWLAWSIISAILCCWPFSIPAIVYAAKVDGLWNNGKYDEARKAAKDARMWTLISIGSAFLFWILYIILILAVGLNENIFNSSFDF